MKEMKFKGKLVKAYRGYESKDFGQWLVNKLHGRMPRKDWLYPQECDYVRLQDLAYRYCYIVLLDEKPANGERITMGHHFTAYEVELEEMWRGKTVLTTAIAFVKK